MKPEQAVYSIAEDAGSLAIKIKRYGSTLTPVTVTCTVTSTGTYSATTSGDLAGYTGPETVTIAAGQTHYTVTLTINHNKVCIPAML